MFHLKPQQTALAVILSLGVGVAFGEGAHANDGVLKIAHAVPPGDPRDLGAQKIKEVVESFDGCSLEVQVYPASQLGSPEVINEGVQYGGIEMSILPAAYLVTTEPLFGVFDFPYFWPADVELLRAAHDGPALQALLRNLERYNYRALSIWYNGHKVWTANRPLRTPDDFSGLTARVMPSPILAEQDIALGMSPVTIPFSEAYTAIQTGAVDAQENPPAITYNMKFHEVQSHVMLSNHGTMDQMVLVNVPWFDQLSDACRTAIEEGVAAGRETILEATLEQDRRALEAFREAGVNIVELSDEEIAMQREAALTHVRDFYIERHGDTGREIVEALEAELGL
jgi:tripartite ATP-independent transporter DctP family solute receptor